MSKVKRNDPCPCGSGKKYKKCCLLKQTAPTADFIRQKIRRTEGELAPILEKHASKYYGEYFFVEAVEEFFLWQGVPDDEFIDVELGEILAPWVLYNWTPDNTEKDVEDHMPEQAIAAHYLQIQGERVPAFTRRFIEQACENQYSFFVIKEVEPGQRMLMRDLLLQQDVTVVEHSASQSLQPGNMVFSRVISLDGTSVMLGCAPLTIPASYHNTIIDLRERMQKVGKDLDNASLFWWNLEIRETYLAIREQLFNPQIPEMVNTDGDPLQPMTLYYDLQCSPQEALDALQTLSLCESAAELLETGEFINQQLHKISFPWLKTGNKQHRDWPNTVMGEIAIDGPKLSIHVNSQNRAAQIKRKITRRLGKRAVFKTEVLESINKMLDDKQSDIGKDLFNTPEAIPEEMQQMLAEMAKKHWQEWLDTSLPALNNQTPRQAAKTQSGRERLEVLLLDFEAKNELAEQPLAPDVDKLREELGLA